jgi:hypothetical protein
MGMVFRIDPPAVAPASGDIRLSGRVMGQLGPAEQLVVWVFRETASADDEASADRLQRGLRLAFGPRLIGAAACGFDGLRRCLVAEPSLAPRFCPLRCACLSADEDTLLHALAAAQLGDRALHQTLTRRFVREAGRLQLWRQSRVLATILGRADLLLPDVRLVELPADAPRH